MAEAQGSLIYQFLRRLLGQLGPREASAEVIKADEGTRTIKGEEDIAQFRAIIKRMMDEALRDAPSAARSKAPEQERSAEGQQSSGYTSAELQARDEAEDDRDDEYEQEHGYRPEDTRYWRDEMQRQVTRIRESGEGPVADESQVTEEEDVGRLHEQRRVLEQLMKQYMPTNPSQDASYQSLIDFWDQTIQEHKRALETYRTRYPARYDREQTSMRGEIET